MENIGAPDTKVLLAADDNLLTLSKQKQAPCPSVSLIVPVYNVAPYVRECMDSIACQTFRDFELVLVDDGSTDQSWDIVQAFIASNSLNAVWLRQGNQGLSAARNAGMKLARGKYICFADSDDILAPDYLETLIQSMAPSCDLAVSGHVCVDENGKVLARAAKNYLPSTEAFDGFDERAASIFISAWGKLYSRALIDQHQLFFPEGLWFEDNYFLPVYISYCKHISTVARTTYYYRQRQDSIMSNTSSAKTLDMISIIEALYHHFQQRCSIPDRYRQRMNRLCVGAYLHTANRLIRGGGTKHIEALTQQLEPLVTNLPEEKNKLVAKTQRSLRWLLRKRWLHLYCIAYDFMTWFAGGKLWILMKKLSSRKNHGG